MILFIGQIARGIRGREAWQEIDYKQFFGGIAKWAVEIDDPARIPEIVTRAFSIATSGRPGPVVIALPEDVLTEQADTVSPLAFSPVETTPAATEMAELEQLLTNAKKPFVILGGSGWNAEAVSAMQSAAETWALPVGVTFRRQMLFDHLHPNYAGDIGLGANPALSSAIRDADVVLLVGSRFGEVPSADYTLLKSPYPDQTLVHVHPDAGELGPRLSRRASHQRVAPRLCPRVPRFERPQGAARLVGRYYRPA